MPATVPGQGPDGELVLLRHRELYGHAAGTAGVAQPSAEGVVGEPVRAVLRERSGGAGGRV